MESEGPEVGPKLNYSTLSRLSRPARAPMGPNERPLGLVEPDRRCSTRLLPISIHTQNGALEPACKQVAAASPARRQASPGVARPTSG